MGDLLKALEAECKHQKLAFGLRLKFSGSSTCIYEATSLKKGLSKVLIKASQLSADHSQDIAKEAERLEAFTHKNIMRVHSLRTLQLSTGTYLFLIQEFAETNLAEVIEKRRTTRKTFKETEILSFTNDMLSALLHMQKHKIAHRDINPFNVFFSGTIPKLGNFTCLKAGLKDADQRASLTGDHLYWSPKSREAALHHKQYHVHNIYKSDMYSLGLTILAMAGLYSTEAMRMLISESTERIVGKLQYSQVLKDLLLGMLRNKQEERLSFEKAKEVIERASVEKTSVTLGQLALPLRTEEGKIENHWSSTSTSLDPALILGGVSAFNATTCDYCKHQPSQPRFKFPGCTHGVCSIECWNTLHAHVSKSKFGFYECKQCGNEVSKDYFRRKLRARNALETEALAPQPSFACGCREGSNSSTNCVLF